MRAVLFARPGGPEELHVGEVDPPQPGPEDLLVHNFAAGVNRADLLQRRGLYPVPADVSQILGLEFAGEVISVGERASQFKTGDRVFGLLSGGGYAERVRVPEQLALRIPDNFSYEMAAAVPEVFITAQEALFSVGALRAGETVLIHAGASGVGTAATQLAKRRGAGVVVTAGTAEKVDFCQQLGADHAIHYRTEDFQARLEELTEGRGVDLVIDVVGGSYWEANIASLRSGGRLVVLGLLGGRKADVDLSKILFKRLGVFGMAMRGLPLEEKAAATRRFRDGFLGDLEAGVLRPIIDQVLLLEEAHAAHSRMEQNLNIGKLILRM